MRGDALRLAYICGGEDMRGGRYEIAPSCEGDISGFCSQSNFAAMPNRRLVLLDKTRFCGTNPLRGFVRMERLET